MTDPSGQPQGWQQPAQQPGYPPADQQYAAPQYQAQQAGYPQYPAQQAGYPQSAAQALPPRPTTLTAACVICFIGGGLDVIELIAGHGGGGGVVVGSLIGAGLWFMVGGFCLRGQNWARITGTVLFGLNCLVTILLVVLLAEAISTINSFNAGLGGGLSGFAAIGTGIIYLVMFLVIALWLMGLAAVVLLWRRESTAFFNAVSAQALASSSWQAPQQQMPQQQQWPQQ